MTGQLCNSYADHFKVGRDYLIVSAYFFIIFLYHILLFIIYTKALTPEWRVNYLSLIF